MQIHYIDLTKVDNSTLIYLISLRQIGKMSDLNRNGDHLNFYKSSSSFVRVLVKNSILSLTA